MLHCYNEAKMAFVISECAAILKEDIRNMGLMTAREVLYQVGRLLAGAEQPESVETMPNPTMRKGG